MMAHTYTNLRSGCIATPKVEKGGVTLSSG